MHWALCNSWRLHKPYKYISISYAIHGFNYRIHIHASHSSLKHSSYDHSVSASQLKVLITIMKNQLRRIKVKFDSIKLKSLHHY